MSYELALAKAWLGLEKIARDKRFSVKLLADEYEVDLENNRILSLSCNVAAKPYVSILILHYLGKRIEGLPKIRGEWVSFKKLSGGQAYFPAFRKRVIEPMLRKYGSGPEVILEQAQRFKARGAEIADVSFVLDVFVNVPMLITLQKADEEFGPEANVLFDRSIEDIFSTEDVVVLAEFVVSNI